MDRGQILCIPLSARPRNDCLVWHYDPKGIYFVRSGYKFEMESNEMGSGSSGSAALSWWQRLWSARIPNKVKIQAWRASHNALPVRGALAIRGLKVDTRCPRCGDEENNSRHALWMCPAAREVWWNSALRRALDSFKGGPISALCLHIADNGRGDDVAIFCMLLWSILFDRNRWVFEGKCDSQEEVFSRAGRLLGDFF